MHEWFLKFLHDLQQTSLLEYLAVVAGIASVWFSKKENILVYPIGLVNTIIYIFLSLKNHLIGEASVNFYYTVISIYGWILWTRKDSHARPVLHISYSSRRDWMIQLGFFAFFYLALFFILSFLKTWFEGAIPWADAFASATAYTGMWLMAKKKLESWYWWIATNIASIPLYAVKGMAMTSVYYIILLILAFMGWSEWKGKAASSKKIA
jgi:nicotinamide mononucleotide transporter